jgi:hypothetical protein
MTSKLFFPAGHLETQSYLHCLCKVFLPIAIIMWMSLKQNIKETKYKDLKQENLFHSYYFLFPRSVFKRKF